LRTGSRHTLPAASITALTSVFASSTMAGIFVKLASPA